MRKLPAAAEALLAKLPEDRRATILALRDVVLANLDPTYEEGVQYGMLGYYVPHSRYPAGYHCDPKQPLPYMGIGAQKHHIGLYLCAVYMNEATQRWFVDAWKKSGKRLDMGKGCVRIKTLDDVPLDVFGELIRRTGADHMIASYDALVASRRKPTKSAATTKKKTAAARPVAATKKPSTKKTVSTKKAAPKKKAPRAR